jgi:hypothetical protein
VGNVTGGSSAVLRYQEQQAVEEFALGAQHVDDATGRSDAVVPHAAAACASSPPKSGIVPSVWNASHAMPCGSVTQCLSDFA